MRHDPRLEDVIKRTTNRESLPLTLEAREVAQLGLDPVALQGLQAEELGQDRQELRRLLQPYLTRLPEKSRG